MTFLQQKAWVASVVAANGREDYEEMKRLIDEVREEPFYPYVAPLRAHVFGVDARQKRSSKGMIDHEVYLLTMDHNGMKAYWRALVD